MSSWTTSMFMATGGVGVDTLEDLTFDLLVERGHLSFQEPVEREEDDVTDGQKEDKQAEHAQNRFGQERGHGDDDEQGDEQSFDVTEFAPDRDKFAVAGWFGRVGFHGLVTGFIGRSRETPAGFLPMKDFRVGEVNSGHLAIFILDFGFWILDFRIAIGARAIREGSRGL
jgi:hypothetical protein